MYKSICKREGEKRRERERKEVERERETGKEWVKERKRKGVDEREVETD
jgi:hypothetical protein